MAIILDRIDAVPLNADGFSHEFKAWLAVLTDSLNAVIQQIESFIAFLNAPEYTSAQITALNAATPTLPNGIILYDSDLNVYVGKEAGSLVKFTTTPYP